MERVTGIGGVFFKAKDPKELQTWYERHLGFVADENGYVSFKWWEGADPTREGQTIWSAMKDSTKYFDPSTRPYMINYRVENLDRMLAQLKAAGVEAKREDSEYGNFAWVMDPEGNRIELWEPPPEKK
jgi:predicted enzyme related to lactoylglutathione lyase